MDHDDRLKALHLSPAHRTLLVESLSHTLATLLDQAEQAEQSKRPIAQWLRDTAGRITTLRATLRRL